MRRKETSHLPFSSASSLYLKSNHLQDRDSGYTEPESDLDTSTTTTATLPSRGTYPFSDDEDPSTTLLKGSQTMSTHSWSSPSTAPALDSASYHSYQADRAIDSIRQYTHEKGWKKVLKHSSGVIVYMLQKPGASDKVTLFKGESVIHGFTPQSVFYVIGMRKLWDDMFEDGNLVQNLNDTTSITYETYRANGSAKAYDLTLVEKIDCSNDGVIMFACTSVETARVAKQPGKTRNEVKLHGWILKLLPTTPPSTHVTFITEEIVRGWIPGLTKKSLARKPLVITSIDNYLKKKAQTSTPPKKEPLASKSINRFLSPLSAYTRRRPSIMTQPVASPPILTNPPPRHSSLRSHSTTKRITFANDVIIPPSPSSQDNDSVPASLERPEVSDTTNSKLYPLSRHRSARKESLVSYKRLLSSDMDEWKKVDEKDGVVMYAKAVQGSALPILRGDGFVEGAWTAEQVCSVVQCFGARSKWDESFDSGEIVERFSQKEYLVSVRMKSLFPISGRDFCVLTQIDSDPRSETIHVVSTSVSDPLLPETEAYTRGRLLIYGWTFQVIKKDDDASERRGVKVTLIAHMDLAGTTPLPSAIIRRLTFQVPTCVLHVKHYLASHTPPPYIRRVAGKVIQETYNPDTRDYKMSYIAKHAPSGRPHHSALAWCTDVRIPWDAHVVTRPPHQHISIVRRQGGIRVYTQDDALEGAVIELEVSPVIETPREPPHKHDDDAQPVPNDSPYIPIIPSTPDSTNIVLGDHLSINGPQLSFIFLLMLISYYIGKSKVVRLIARSEVGGARYWLHIHENEDLTCLLTRLCAFYPSEWQPGVVYHVYVDNGGIYSAVDSAFWLRDKDHILVTTHDDVSDIPDIDLNAVHAKLRPGVVLQPHQELGIQLMIRMEQTIRGGILADEMGLGKTLQVLTTLIRQQPKLDTQAKTLIIVPSHGVAHHWTEEIRTKSNFGSLPYFIYQEETVFLMEQPCFKVVITTYDRVRSEYQRRHVKNQPSPLFDFKWNRVVLDECNKLRNIRTKLADAITDLNSTYRWCLTGTPLQNDISELWPIFKFLRVDLPVDKRQDLEYVTGLLRKHMIRRKKKQLQPHLELKPKKEIRVELEFTDPERALYDYLETILYKQLKVGRSIPHLGDDALGSSLLYLRLKQVCGHHKLLLDKFPDLIPTSQTQTNEQITKILTDEAMMRGGRHHRRGEDNELRQVCDIIKDFYDQCDENELTQPNIAELEKLPFMSQSTKVSWLVKFLTESLEKSPQDKIVVVSQFVDLLMIVTQTLKDINIKHVTYMGDMANYKRKSSLEIFNYSPSCQVLLLSLKAGGVGLNLQCANHMVLLDRWWNPATMDQAIARIHRMNQTKETYIHTVIIKDTIEEGLLDNVLKKKNDLFSTVVDRIQPLQFSKSEQLLDEPSVEDEDHYMDLDDTDDDDSELENHTHQNHHRHHHFLDNSLREDLLL